MHEECFRGAVEAIVTYLFPGFPTLKLYNFNVHVPEGGSLGMRLTYIGWVVGTGSVGLVNLCMFLNHSQSSHHSYHHLQYKYIAGLEFGPGSNNRGVTVCPLVHCIHKQLSVIVGGGMLHCYGDTNTKIKIYQSIWILTSAIQPSFCCRSWYKTWGEGPRVKQLKLS